MEKRISKEYDPPLYGFRTRKSTNLRGSLELCGGEDDRVELLWKSGQVVPSSQTQRPSSDTPPILRGSGSGERNDPLPLPQRPPPLHRQNLFIQGDEMSSWLHHAPPPPPLPQPSAPYGQIIASRRAENFLRLRGNILSGGRVEAGPWIPVGLSATTSFSATESNLTPATKSRPTVIGGVSRTFAVPSRGPKEKTVEIQTVCEIAGTSSSGVEIEPVQIQPATDIAEDRERKEIEETIAGIQGTEEARGSTSGKRSRAAEMHNVSERRRREKINEKMKTLQELIPRCNKSNKASMLDDVIEYVKWLQMQIQMTSMGHGMMPPMMYAGNMQQFMPHMAMGMMGMNRPPPFIQAYLFPGTPFPRAAHMAGAPPPLQSRTTSQLSFDQASSSKEPDDDQPTG